MRPRFLPREPINGLTHLAGAILSVGGLVALVIVGSIHGSEREITAFAIFGASLVLLYTASSLYHSLRLSERRLRALRRVDHMMIFVLIAGTYTPICLVLLHGRLAVALLVAVWATAAMGVLQKTLWLDAPCWLSTLLYLAMGWMAILIGPRLLAAAPTGFFAWLITGGILYSVGAVIYATKWPRGVPGVFGFHEIWHLFVLAGSFSHYWAVFAYVARPA
ncbi:MAG: PAQR family membrane homeostasis protein TrhA [Gemmatimonadaceae bacterium]